MEKNPEKYMWLKKKIPALKKLVSCTFLVLVEAEIVSKQPARLEINLVSSFDPKNPLPKRLQD